MIEIKVNESTDVAKVTTVGSSFSVFRELMQAINGIATIIKEECNIPYDEVYKAAAETQPIHDKMISSTKTEEVTEK